METFYSEYEEGESFDSMPSMASERSTHISTMKCPYQFSTKIFDKLDEDDSSPTIHHVEKVKKQPNTKFIDFRSRVTQSQVMSNIEYVVEFDRTDPFLQPSVNSAKTSQPAKKKIKGIKVSQDNNENQPPSDWRESIQSYQPSLSNQFNTFKSVSLVAHTEERETLKERSLNMPFNTSYEQQRMKSNFQQSDKENSLTSESPSASNQILTNRSERGENPYLEKSFGIQGQKDSISEFQTSQHFPLSGVAFYSDRNKSNFNSPIQEEPLRTNWSPVKALRHRFGWNVKLEVSRESLQADSTVQFDKSEYEKVDHMASPQGEDYIIDSVFDGSQPNASKQFKKQGELSQSNNVLMIGLKPKMLDDESDIYPPATPDHSHLGDTYKKEKDSEARDYQSQNDQTPKMMRSFMNDMTMYYSPCSNSGEEQNITDRKSEQYVSPYRSYRQKSVHYQITQSIAEEREDSDEYEDNENPENGNQQVTDLVTDPATDPATDTTLYKSFDNDKKEIEPTPLPTTTNILPNKRKLILRLHPKTKKPEDNIPEVHPEEPEESENTNQTEQRMTEQRMDPSSPTPRENTATKQSQVDSELKEFMEIENLVEINETEEQGFKSPFKVIQLHQRNPSSLYCSAHTNKFKTPANEEELSEADIVDKNNSNFKDENLKQPELEGAVLDQVEENQEQEQELTQIVVENHSTEERQFFPTYEEPKSEEPKPVGKGLAKKQLEIEPIGFTESMPSEYITPKNQNTMYKFTGKHTEQEMRESGTWTQQFPTVSSKLISTTSRSENTIGNAATFITARDNSSFLIEEITNQNGELKRKLYQEDFKSPRELIWRNEKIEEHPEFELFENIMDEEEKVDGFNSPQGIPYYDDIPNEPSSKRSVIKQLEHYHFNLPVIEETNSTQYYQNTTNMQNTFEGKQSGYDSYEYCYTDPGKFCEDSFLDCYMRVKSQSCIDLINTKPSERLNLSLRNPAPQAETQPSHSRAKSRQSSRKIGSASKMKSPVVKPNIYEALYLDSKKRNAKKEELLHQKHLEETKTIQALQNNNLHKGMLSPVDEKKLIDRLSKPKKDPILQYIMSPKSYTIENNPPKAPAKDVKPKSTIKIKVKGTKDIKVSKDSINLSKTRSVSQKVTPTQSKNSSMILKSTKTSANNSANKKSANTSKTSSKMVDRSRTKDIAPYYTQNYGDFLNNYNTKAKAKINNDIKSKYPFEEKYTII